MEYQIVISTNINEMVNRVNAEMKKGWLAQGGATVRTLGKYDSEMIQAMIKPNKNVK